MGPRDLHFFPSFRTFDSSFYPSRPKRLERCPAPSRARTRTLGSVIVSRLFCSSSITNSGVSFVWSYPHDSARVSQKHSSNVPHLPTVYACVHSAPNRAVETRNCTPSHLPLFTPLPFPAVRSTTTRISARYHPISRYHTHPVFIVPPAFS